MKKYGRIRWVTSHEEFPENAKYLVCYVAGDGFHFEVYETPEVFWIIKIVPTSALNKLNYEKTLTEFRKLINCNTTIWVEMPKWKLFQLYPEMELENGYFD